MKIYYVNSCWWLIILLVSPITCITESCSNVLPNPSLDATLSTGSLTFAFNLYKLFQGQENVFLSPFSVRVALAMTAVGAGGTTLSQMNQALQLTGFQNHNQTNQAFLDLLSSFCPSNAFYSLNTANRIYIEQTFPVLQTFIDTLNQYYLAQARNVDFQSNSSAVRNEINQWVASQTDNTIPELLVPGTIDSSTIMAIVNAVFFKGTWSVRFNSSLTTNRAFVSSSGSTLQVPMMRLTAPFNYTFNQALNSQILQLNYTGNRLAMFVILPKQKVDLKTVQNGLNTASFTTIRQSLELQRVDVSLPKFNVTFKAELREYLQSLGMKDVFGGSADLSGMAAGGGGLFVSTVVHQGFVAVNEEGTTAAAATAVVLSKALPPEPELFLANRPFIFIIYDLVYDQILFIGNLNNPST